MSNVIKNVGILLKPRNVLEFTTIIPNITEWLIRRKKTVTFLSTEHNRIQKYFKTIPKQVSFEDHSEFHKLDLIITLGGDGTLIGISRKCQKKSPPIFGINMGRLGFITEFSKVEYFDELAKTLKGNYEISKLQLYKVEVSRKNKSIFKANFINDVVINKNNISRMFSLTAESDSELIYNVSGDGLIISTPIGSTAYSLAAGGPIIHPEVNALVLTPICPHSLNHRPLVIPDNKSIDIKFPIQEDHLTLTIDGQEACDIDKGCIVTISKVKNSYAKFIKNPDRTYFHTLKEKLTHGQRENL
ncbi:NAD(+)/NADH kinase [Halobacteriovorax sp. HLS]|uniref:NAD(+)/NADH kinase n=1 Tax=Halobacteriovorax sp. HLS TaxID=2234000 RepID=UPI000FDC842F|nr:NAD(+)/NADH kinase [Halobacteriovorax sp. HLS]